MNVNTAQQAQAKLEALIEALTYHVSTCADAFCECSGPTHVCGVCKLGQLVRAAIAEARKPAASSAHADLDALAESALRSAAVTAQEPVVVWADRLVASVFAVDGTATRDCDTAAAKPWASEMTPTRREELARVIEESLHIWWTLNDGLDARGIGEYVADAILREVGR